MRLLRDTRLIAILSGLACVPLIGSTASAQTAGKAEMPESPLESVFKRLKLYGDFRYRNEYSFHLDSKSSRYRQRLRFRLGANYELSEEALLGVRIVTGDSDDPNSSHITLGNGFDNFEVTMDRAFVTYTPGWWKSAAFTVGKFDNPFYRNPVYGELVWDADVQPEGGLVELDYSDLGFVDALEVKFGGYQLLEQSSSDDAFTLAGQVSARRRFSEELSATAAVGFYYYTDPTPDGSLAIIGDNDSENGNATRDENGDGIADEFVSDFGILNPIIGVTSDRWSRPVTVSAEFIHNTRANIDRDTGWAVGTSVGSSAKKGDWLCYYQWQVVEQDAVFSPFAQDDTLFPVNHRSHITGINYQIADKIGLHLWALVSSRDVTFSSSTTNSDQEQWRLRLDLNIKL